MTDFRRPELISPEHEVASFDCGSDAQTLWLREHAVQANGADSARVYVTCVSGTNRVAGYYALSAGSVAHESAPSRIAQGLGRYPIPVIILTRLGVDRTHHGHGVGKNLVHDALLQTASVAERVGVRALLIQAESPRAAAFYRCLDPAFEELPGDPLQIVLLMKDLRAAIRQAVVLAASDGERS